MLKHFNKKISKNILQRGGKGIVRYIRRPVSYYRTGKEAYLYGRYALLPHRKLPLQ
jgi:hypothetical protein